MLGSCSVIFELVSAKAFAPRAIIASSSAWLWRRVVVLNWLVLASSWTTRGSVSAATAPIEIRMPSARRKSSIEPVASASRWRA